MTISHVRALSLRRNLDARDEAKKKRDQHANRPLRVLQALPPPRYHPPILSPSPFYFRELPALARE